MMQSFLLCTVVDVLLTDLPLHEDWELQSFLPLRVSQRYVWDIS